MKTLWGFLLLLMGLLGSLSVHAQGNLSASLIADTESGYLFFKHNETQELAPASLTKLMTLYMTFGALDKGWIKWQDRLPISEYAAMQPRTNLDLVSGQTMTVREAVDALIVHSANDAAVVLAEALGSSEERFVKMMNEMAAQLNMRNTVFKNASGLHEEGQKTTARDVALLALSLIQHFPKYYPLFAQKSFDFNGRTYVSHNYVLQDYEGAEGMKTGYVAAVGYNLVTTAQKNGRRILGVLMGLDSIPERDRMMMTMLDEGFKRVINQQQAVASGQLNPAMDPLHRRFMVQKTNMDVFSFEMKKNIHHALTFKPMTPIPVETYTPSKVNQHLWTIQVGAFQSVERAMNMAQRAMTLLHEPTLKPLTNPKASLFRAQLTGFSDKVDAVKACRILNQSDYPCFLVSNSG